MIAQILLDGVLTGALLGLGAIGLTLTYSLLRFANFAHGEFATVGAYAALVVAAALGTGIDGAPFGGLTFGWPPVIGLGVAMLVTGGLAVALDAVLFARLRRHGTQIVLVIASFGASLALRNLLEFGFGPSPQYFSRDIAFGVRLPGGARATWNQLAVLALALGLMVAVHLLLTRTAMGRAMRAASENPQLAKISGIDVDGVIRGVWLLGGALAAAAGVMLGVLVQVRPTMGFELLLPLFAAAIVGGIGSVPGALVGGLLVGIAEAASVPLVGAQYRAAIGFIVLLVALLVRPTGLFGKPAG
jgi:branched-chain amino acid transport system permease protein